MTNGTKITMENQKLTVLDCTLRDGGYYNEWDFSTSLVERYFQAVDDAGIDVVEVGLRSFVKEGFLGAYAYSTDEFLSQLSLPKKARLAVMVNASDLIKHEGGTDEAVRKLFKPTAASPVSIVRVACHVHEVEKVEIALRQLKDLGYQTVINLMQISRSSDENIVALTNQLDAWGTVDVLYFADSLGNMDRHQVQKCLATIRQGWSGPIGIHAHDNMGHALSNTLEAIQDGASWADATMLGMGRGAGNARMEFLVCELGRRGMTNYNADSLLSVVMDDFKKMQDECRWGPNLLYFMSARDDIHPTYVQTMYNELQYDLPHVLGVLKGLKNMEGHAFNAESLVRADEGKLTEGIGSWSANGWLEGRDVLLLGAGPSAKKHNHALVEFIKSRNLAVLAINTTPTVPEELITAYLACHPTRILMESDQYVTLQRPIILPLEQLHDFFLEKIERLDILDFGMKVESRSFEVRDNGCTIPSVVAAAYGMAVATSAGARRILLAGFDGGGGLPEFRRLEMVEIFDAYQQMEGALPLLSITPTTFPVPQSSLYAPDV